MGADLSLGLHQFRGNFLTGAAGAVALRGQSLNRRTRLGQLRRQTFAPLRRSLAVFAQRLDIFQGNVQSRRQIRALTHCGIPIPGEAGNRLLQRRDVRFMGANLRHGRF